MFSNIVVALKPEVPSTGVLVLARKAAAPSAKIHLVTLVQVGTNEDEAERLEAARRNLESIASSLTADGYEVTTEAGFINAGAAADLNRITDRRGADLIVIGLAKRSRVSKALIGSDAQRVLLSSGCPVLSAPLAE